MTHETSTRAYYLRWVLCLIIACAITTAAVIHHRSGESNVPEIDLFSAIFFFACMALFVPLMVLGVIGMQSLNAGMSSTPRPWTRPRLQDNPLQMRNPLKSVHFMAQLFAVAGSVMAMTGLWASQPVLIQGLLTIWFGLLLFASVRLAEKVYAKRMAEAD